MEQSAHVDTFARDRLPPPEQWPEFRFTIPAVQYPPRVNCAAELLDCMVDQGFGDRPALVAADGRRTYAELLADANRVANVLRDELGLVPGNRVLLHGFNNATIATLWLAVVKAGGIAVTTMPLLRAKELTEVVVKAQRAIAIGDRRLAAELEAARPQCPTLQTVVYSHDDRPAALAARMARRSAAFANCDTATDDVALIAFTSGTTGKPKGTMHFHRDLLAICDTFAPALVGAGPSDVFTGTPPLAFTFGLGGILLFPLRVGASTVLLEKVTPASLLTAIAAEKVTICFTAPTSYRAMTPLVAGHDLRHLRVCVSAGEALPIATRAGWEAATGIKIVDGIGSTEMLHIFIGAAGDAIRPGATGKAVPGYIACVLDERGAPLAPGNVGRLAVKGPTGCRYLDDARQTEYVHDGWNITGDAYVMDDDGYFWYQSRTDDMIVSSGYNIAGPEVEAALLEHPAVLECAVVGIPDPERTQLVTAYVVLRAGTPASAELRRDLQDFVKATIAPYKYPRAIHFIDALPRTQTGKLQRFKLRQPGAPA